MFMRAFSSFSCSFRLRFVWILEIRLSEFVFLEGFLYCVASQGFSADSLFAGAEVGVLSVDEGHRFDD